MATTTGAVNSAVRAEPKRSTFARRNPVGRILLWIAVILVTFIALAPFVFAIITSFKTQVQSIDGTLIPWLQFQPTLDNWQQELGQGGRETVKALTNSAIIAIGATLLATTLGSLAGYGLARFKYGVGNRNLVSWFLSQRFLPPIATAIPFVLVFKNLKLLDTHLGLIIANATFVLPFAVLIMRDFFADFPVELSDAAQVDGANQFQVFWRVALPLAAPALVASTIICFTFSWNEFLFASVLTSKDARPYPLLVAGGSTVRGIMFNYVSTRLVVAVAAPVILSLFVQRYVVRGLTLGAVKG